MVKSGVGLGILPVASALFGSDRMYESRVMEGIGRTLIVENDDGDRFTFAFPTPHVLDVHLEGPTVWKSGNAPDVAAIWIDDARHLAIQAAREKGWLPHAV